MKFQFITTLLLVLLFTNDVFAQKDLIAYRKESEEIRKQVYAWDRAEFNVKTVPAEYANASKVVIAHHTELTADSKSKLAYYGISFGMKRVSNITEIVREKIKLNDKTAVEEYSELSFTLLAKQSGLFTKTSATTYIGVRVIKPDNSIKEINADDIVLTKDESKSKRAKLAIPDLQPGDIVDYFIATDQEMKNDMAQRSYNVFLFNDAPVMHYSFHGQLGKKYAIDYRSYNGAPDLKVSVESDKDIVIDVEKKNMPAFETSLWIAPVMQLPIIRMNISLGMRGGVAKRLGYAKPGEVNKNKGSDELVEDLGDQYAAEYPWQMQASYATFVAAKSYANKLKLKWKEMTDEDKAALLYYTFRFQNLLAFNIDQMERSLNIGKYSYDGLAALLYAVFKNAEVDPGILVTTEKNGIRMNEVMDKEDFTAAAYLPGRSNKLFALRSVYDAPFQTPGGMDGVTNSRTMTLKAKFGKVSTDIAPGIKIPGSTAEQNARIEQLLLSVNLDKNNMAVQRKAIVKGQLKEDAQEDIILYEDLYEAERVALGINESLLEGIEESKKGRKYVDEVKNALEEAKKEQKTAFADDAKSWFAQEITDVKDFKVNNLGIRHTSPDFVYSSSFNMDGLIKKAGNNLIVDIGKIQGDPLTIKKEQRTRDLDIYMSCPRTFEYQVELAIPAGYTAEGVEALNRNVSNETGLFTVIAAVKNDAVQIKIRKQYAHAFEPKANWEKMMAFIDAATEWSSAKLLLKKK